MKTINGSGEYFAYTFDIAKQEGSDTVFEITADIEQLEEFDDNWKVNVVIYPFCQFRI